MVRLNPPRPTNLSFADLAASGWSRSLVAVCPRRTRAVRRRRLKRDMAKTKRQKLGLPPGWPIPGKRALRILNEVDYSFYLKTKYWRKIRALIINRDRYRCVWCGKSPNHFEVHHEFYRGRGMEKPKDLITLCPDCHSNHHDAEHEKRKPMWREA